MSDLKLAQDLDAAVAAYQRHYGRIRTIEKLSHMLRSREEAQRVSDDATQRQGAPVPRAAE
mgnify:CR=1 FL=1